MRAKLRIASELGIFELPCEASRPELNLPEDFKKNPQGGVWHVGRGWEDLEVREIEFTPDALKYIKELHDLKADTSIGRMSYGGGIKKDVEIVYKEDDRWVLKGCYFLNLEKDSLEITFDRALLIDD